MNDDEEILWASEREALERWRAETMPGPAPELLFVNEDNGKTTFELDDAGD